MAAGEIHSRLEQKNGTLAADITEALIHLVWLLRLLISHLQNQCLAVAEIISSRLIIVNVFFATRQRRQKEEDKDKLRLVQIGETYF